MSNTKTAPRQVKLHFEAGIGGTASLEEYTPLRFGSGGDDFFGAVQYILHEGELRRFLPHAGISGETVLYTLVGEDNRDIVGGSFQAERKSVPTDEIRDLETAFRELYNHAEDPSLPPKTLEVIRGFRLPSPKLQPECYRLVRGKGSNRRLLIIWGLESEPGTSLGPLEAIEVLKQLIGKSSATTKHSRILLLLALALLIAAGAWMFWGRDEIGVAKDGAPPIGAESRSNDNAEQPSAGTDGNTEGTGIFSGDSHLPQGSSAGETAASSPSGIFPDTPGGNVRPEPIGVAAGEASSAQLSATSDEKLVAGPRNIGVTGAVTPPPLNGTPPANPGEESRPGEIAGSESGGSDTASVNDPTLSDGERTSSNIDTPANSAGEQLAPVATDDSANLVENDSSPSTAIEISDAGNVDEREPGEPFVQFKLTYSPTNSVRGKQIVTVFCTPHGFDAADADAIQWTVNGKKKSNEGDPCPLGQVLILPAGESTLSVQITGRELSGPVTGSAVLKVGIEHRGDVKLK